MKRRLAALLAAGAPLFVFAREKKLTEEERLALIRGMTAEFAKAKVLIPRAKKPLPFESAGTWDKEAWEEANLSMGPAARVGEMVQITKINVENDRIEL
jgi:hypothetical protein